MFSHMYLNSYQVDIYGLEINILIRLVAHLCATEQMTHTICINTAGNITTTL
jgi:hypothetical protein